MFINISKLACIIALSILLTAGIGSQPTAAGEAMAEPAGQEDIPVMANQVCYTIQKGDTLSEIAMKFGVSLELLTKANNLSSSLIFPDDVLIIPSKGSVPALLSRGDVSREDLMLLARVIHAEARGESFTGKVAVGAVILNRMNSPHFPNSIREVILQEINNVYQFSPVADGTINLTPDEAAINAAVQALWGHDPTGGALFFYNPTISTDKWIFGLPVKTRIGNHLFAGA